MELSRHAFVLSSRVMPFLQDQDLLAACRKELLEWAKTNIKVE
ncbi:hypothetical protein [Pleomorphomonas carboxyditropha]|nr:hypothetical protein [Pleomorphomonas carboxyditropha]